MLALSFLVMVMATTPAQPKVVAPDWHGVNVKPELLVFYADALAEALRRQGLRVITAQDVSNILGYEREKQLVGCPETATSCLTELANALGCDAMLVVNLARFDDGGFNGLAKVIRSSDGLTLSTAKLMAPNERALLEAIEAAGQALAQPLRNAAKPGASLTSNPTPTVGPQRLWWIPAVVGAAGVAVGTGLLIGARQKYDGLASAPTHADAQAQALSGQTLQTGGTLALGAGGAALATAAVLFFWPQAPVVPAVTTAPHGASVWLRGTFR